jgi:O-Antigen ligase
MIYGASSPSGKKSSFGLQPAPAWTAIFVLILLAVLGTFGGAGRIVNLIFPVGTGAVGLFLYYRYPILYFGFSWWLWFLCPLLRRLIDDRIGYTDGSPILLAPYLYLAPTLITVWRYLPKSKYYETLPFALPIVGTLYSFAIALVLRSPSVAIKALLDWLIPVSFGYYVFMNWREYPNYSKNIQRVFVWGILIMGIYGVYQYIVAPSWDILWLVSSGQSETGIGIPGPFNLRVWSTLNSVEPFSGYMAAGLLLLFHRSGILNIAASVTGYCSLLLTLTRSAWIGYLVGLLALVMSLKPKHQTRILITVALLVIMVIPLASMEQFSENINSRIDTISNIQEDGSSKARQSIYADNLFVGLTNPIGDGIGGDAYDSGILNILRNLGWAGSILYGGGMFMGSWQLFKDSDAKSDPLAMSIRAGLVSCLARLPMNNPMVGSSGIVLWGFIAIAMAARKYYIHQQDSEE